MYIPEIFECENYLFKLQTTLILIFNILFVDLFIMFFSYLNQKYSPKVEKKYFKVLLVEIPCIRIYIPEIFEYDD